MTTKLSDTYGRAQHRPLVDAIAKLGGLKGDEGIANGADNHIDPLELAAQRGARTLASTLLKKLGWEIELVPPARPARKPAPRAESDGGGER